MFKNEYLLKLLEKFENSNREDFIKELMALKETKRGEYSSQILKKIGEDAVKEIFKTLKNEDDQTNCYKMCKLLKLKLPPSKKTVATAKRNFKRSLKNYYEIHCKDDFDQYDKDYHAHHIIPVDIEPFFGSDKSANMILLHKNQHEEIHKLSKHAYKESMEKLISEVKYWNEYTKIIINERLELYADYFINYR